MPFSLEANPSINQISDAINYLLNNFGSNVSIDLSTGIIAGPSGRISNLYKYISIKYATSYDGTVGFSNVPTGATYYGIRNSNETTESVNPADYIWYNTTGFGSTNYLWYIVAGGRQIDFYISPTQPSDYYVKDPGTPIDIDIVTTTKTVNVAFPTIYKWTSGTAPTRPTTTSTYTWATASFSAPSGWSTSPTTDSTPSDVQWAITIPISANSNVATITLDWTNTSYPIVQFSANGATGATGSTGSTGLSSLTAYKSLSQTASPPSTPANTTGATAPSTWSLTAPSLTAGNILYYSFGQYNSSSATINGIPAGQTQWGTPTAASVFQDILSDNWNGSLPMPSTGGTVGTTGWYLSKSSGNIYGTNGVFRGDITGSSGTFSGNLNTSGQGLFQGNNGSSVSFGGYPIYYSIFGNTPITPTSTLTSQVGVLGVATSLSGKNNIGLAGFGYNEGAIPGFGVYGYGGNTGGYFTGGTYAIALSGGTLNYSGVIIQDPSLLSVGSNYFLRGDGAWSLISAITSGVSSFNTRTGAVTLSSGDVTGALGFTPYNSSNPSGYVTASTSSLTNYSTTTATQSYINSYAAHQFNADTGTAFVSSGNLNIYVTITGYQSAGSGNTITIQSVSDRALKQNIVPESLGLDFINELIPVSYSMIKGDGRKMHGFIAQDVAPFITGDNDALKITNPDGTKGLDYLSLIGPMAKAIQELSEQVDQLKVALNQKSG